MTLENYYANIKAILTASPIVRKFKIRKERFLYMTLYFDIVVELIDSSELYIVEYLFFEDKVVRDKYKYHWQKKEKIIRWDNVYHHPEIESFPHHKHVGNRLEASKEVGLEDVLKEIQRKIGKGGRV